MDERREAVEVLRVYEDDERPAEARFVIDAGAFKDDYILEYDWTGDEHVSWVLSSPGSAAQVPGRRVRPRRRRPEGTEVTYRLAVDVKIPMIGMIKRKAEKVIVDTALKGLKAARRTGREHPVPCGSSCSPARAGSARRPRPPAPRRSAAARGLKTLVLSTDAAHSLGRRPGRRAARGRSRPRSRPGCSSQQVDAQRRFEQGWGEVRATCSTVLDAVGVDPVAAEELTVLPGAEEVLALLEVRDQVRSGPLGPGGRRLRADRRDAAAAGPAGGAGLVRRAGVPGGAAARADAAPDAGPGGRGAGAPATASWTRLAAAARTSWPRCARC